MEVIHSSTEPVRQISQNLTVMYTKSRVLAPAFLGPISESLKSLGPNAQLDLAKLLPTVRRRRYEWVEALKQGLDIPLIHVTYAPGSNVGNLHWVWHCTAENIDEALSISQQIMAQIKGDIPEYHTRAIRRESFQLFGLTTPTTKKAVLRHIYKVLVGDCSSAANLLQSEIDERVHVMFDLEEPSLIYDLRNHYGQKTKFDEFWSCAKDCIDVGSAVDDRRHSTVIHMAKAISVRDLREKVLERCLPNIPVPSDESIRLQFFPVCQSSHTKVKCTDHL